jgi:dTDP-glucose 4,6-dehydratase
MASDPRGPAPRAVITGGAGFIGSHLCEALIEAGFEVACLDNFLTGSPLNVAHLTGDPAFRLVRYDVTNYVPVPGPIDLVLHFASPASPVDYLTHPVDTLKVGAIGTLHALGLAREKRARFILASTSEVYGDPQIHPQPESYWGHVNPVGPRSVYDEAKRYAEALTTAYRTTYGVDTAIARIFNTFGPRMGLHDGRVIPTFIRQALAGEVLTVAGDGRQTRSFCYLDDLVGGIFALARSGHPGPVNLGNPTELSIQRIAEDVLQVTGSLSRIEYVDRPVDDPQRRRLDITLAVKVIGWRPRVAWLNGLSRTVSWFQWAGSRADDRIVRARSDLPDGRQPDLSPGQVLPTDGFCTRIRSIRQSERKARKHGANVWFRRSGLRCLLTA